MRLVDANVLLYAVNADAKHHAASREWLDRALCGADTVGFTWVVLLAFVRLTTKVGLFPNPLSIGDAMAQVDAWLTAPGARLLDPDRGHARTMAELLSRVGTGGNLTTDAHLAAIAVENRASIVSYDTGFDRFGSVRRERPDDLLAG